MLFHTLWPKFKDSNFVPCPIIKVTRGTERLIQLFYNEADFLNWQSNTPKWNQTYKVTRLTSLSNLSNNDTSNFFESLPSKTVCIKLDPEVDKFAMTFAFSRKKENVDARKTAVDQTFEANDVENYGETMSVFDLINQDLIKFHLEVNQRCIPSLLDGFKPSQRQIFTSAVKDAYIEKRPLKSLVATAKAKFGYAHGQVSLSFIGFLLKIGKNKTIIVLLKNFILKN